MRLVLHRKVCSDIEKVMEYYEQVATPELANEFYAGYDISWRRQRSGQNLSRFESVTCGQ